MPGFRIGNTGAGPSGLPRAYLSYTWKVDNIFDKTVRDDDPLIYLRDATLPTFTITKEQVQGASLEYKFAKSVAYDDVKVTWYDTVGMLGKMLEWRKQVWTPEKGLAPVSDYKKNTVLQTFLPTDESTNSWKLINSWPSTIRYGDLTYTQSDVKLVDITVTYDWAEESG